MVRELPVSRAPQRRAVEPLPIDDSDDGDDGDDGDEPETLVVGRRPHQPVESQARSDSLKDAVTELERQRIIDALKTCGGNQTRAAEMLGISRRTLVNRLDQYDLPRPRKEHPTR